MVRSLRSALSLIIPLLLLATWFALHWTKGAENSFIADPRLVWETLASLRGELAENSLLSLRRLLIGVLAGTLLGVSTGITLGRTPWVRRLLGPTLNVLTAVPIIVLIPFFLMALGFGELFRVGVVAAIVFLLVYQAVIGATVNFPRQLLELAAHREKTEWQIAFQMLLPSTIPEIVRAIRLSFLFGWLAIAFAEEAVAEWPRGGLGYQILRSRGLGQYEELFAAIIVLGAIAWSIDSFLGWLERNVSHWRKISGDSNEPKRDHSKNQLSSSATRA